MEGQQGVFRWKTRSRLGRRQIVGRKAQETAYRGGLAPAPQPTRPDRRLDPSRARREGPVSLCVPGLAPGDYRVVLWDTVKGVEGCRLAATSTRNGVLAAMLP